MNMNVRQHKVLFVGPVGVGKTTAVTVLSDKKVISTDVLVSDMTRFRKPQTTVAFDYGVVELRNDLKVHLYGAPGQQRFDFMWDILELGLTGFAVLIDHSRRAPLNDLAFFLDWYQTLKQPTRLAVGIGCHGNCAPSAFSAYGALLRERGLYAPVMPVDVRNRDDMRQFLHALIFDQDSPNV